MPNNRAIIDVKPSNYGIVDVKPKFKTSNIGDVTTVYTETRTINKGQPVPWGLNWLITYPIQLLNFPANRS